MVSVEKKQSWYTFASMALLFISITVVLLSAYIYLNTMFIKSQFSSHNTMVTLIKHNFKNYLDHQKSAIQELASNENLIRFCAENSSDTALIMPLLHNTPSDVIILDAQYKKLFTRGNQIERYNNETVHQSAQRSLFLAMPDVIDIVEFEPSPELAVLVSTPIFKRNNLVGFIAIKLDTQKIINTLLYPYITNEQSITITQMIQDKLITLIPHDKTLSIEHYTDVSHIKSGIYKQAAHGQSGTLHIDKTMFTWQYIPEMQWGITLETTQATPNPFLVTVRIAILVLMLLTAIGALYYSYHTWQYMRKTTNWHALLFSGAHVGLYMLFMFNIMTVVLFSAEYYRTAHLEKQKHTLQKSISLFTVAPEHTVDVHSTKLYLFIFGIIIIACTIALTSYSIIFYAHNIAGNKNRLIYCFIVALFLTITKLFIVV